MYSEIESMVEKWKNNGEKMKEKKYATEGLNGLQIALLLLFGLILSPIYLLYKAFGGKKV